MPADGNIFKPAVRMEWTNLLFLHWRVDVGLMQGLVPPEVEIDTFGGSAWIALVPFRMENTAFRGVPRLPGLSSFYECNVRTYVNYRGRAGVWFFSLDAERLLPVLGGRWWWNLNYVHSDFNVNHRAADSVIEYRLKRRPGRWRPAQTNIVWRSGERKSGSKAGTLEHFLTERYWLFTQRFGVIVGGEVVHEPWTLREAEVLSLDDSLIAAAGVTVKEKPLAWASDFLSVKGFALQAFTESRLRLPAQVPTASVPE